MKILVVDDNASMRTALQSNLTSQDYEVLLASTGMEAIEAVEAGFDGVILLDLQLPDLNGLEVFRRIQGISSETPVIFITASTNMDVAVEAIRQGGFDFLSKGKDFFARLPVSVKNAAERLRLKQQVTTLQGRYQRPFSRILTQSSRMMRVVSTLESIVNSTAAVLIEGESGTGKEVIARAIHQEGNRRSRPFIAVNCAGIPETLLESEMFGYEKGAFTGATSRRIGKFEAADGGTLFLDEVGELPRALQAKLLRVLQDHAFQRVGGTETIQVDVRILSATNRDLRKAVANGEFRDDLYYRLAVFPVRLPPLRERPEDIPLLAHHFLVRFREEEKKTILGLSPEAIDLLLQHPFPGNVRELENVIRHAIIVADGPELQPQDIRMALRLGPGEDESPRQGPLTTRRTIPSGGALEESLAALFPDEASLVPLDLLEEAYLRQALAATGGNTSRAARALKVGRTTIYRRLGRPDDSAMVSDTREDERTPSSRSADEGRTR
ncbi:MAG TPA: sigma-54 dependent transcriptional regulator [Myxococcota bacterium]|nr:sigma-54 dependent transcriptional regulator [Myxococcota bacterium]HQK52282.1 sigma-54 dependent transcriptional regulator [Myxococcota bacterium]